MQIEENQDFDQKVIAVNFNRSTDKIPNEVSHPASKNFPLEMDLDDPLTQLLNEGRIEKPRAKKAKIDFISHTQNQISDLSFMDSLIVMAEKILKKSHHLNETSKRTKYYLDELNFKDIDNNDY